MVFIKKPPEFLRYAGHVRNDNAVVLFFFSSPPAVLVFFLDLVAKGPFRISTSFKCIPEMFVVLLLGLGTCWNTICSVSQGLDEPDRAT